ncbi:MAG: M48 family metalloprotease [Acidobacteriales bacterium]|nr:M48 family metalloprotease [Terriglobales bacterium]
MVKRLPLILVVLFAVGCATAVMFGTRQPEVSLASVLEIWGDVLRDVDQAGLGMTRVSDAEEMTLGRNLAAASPWPPATDPTWQSYVEDVGRALTYHVRRPGIQYQFHVVEQPTPNAFAVAGGHVYITTGMLTLLETEAELASILGHEISHVDLRHCVERYQYALKLEKVHAAPAGQMVDMFRTLASVEYAKYQEMDADAQGVRLAVESGYAPDAAVRVFYRLNRLAAGRGRRVEKSPVAESVRVAGQALGDYFRSHPPSADRAAHLNEQIRRYRAGGAVSGAPYEGRENYQRRIAASRQRFS